jgi:hypothetical protein
MLPPDSAGADPQERSSVSSNSCNIYSDLHEVRGTQANPSSHALPQTAIAKLREAELALHQWRLSLEKEALFGQLHPYPHEGKVRYNYYPDAGDSRPGRKDKRQYVSQALERGEKAKQLRQIEQSLTLLMQEAQTIT